MGLKQKLFGCFIAVDDPSKRLKIQDQKAKRSSCSEDFWSSSRSEMEHSGVQSQGSISSTNASNLDPSGSTSHPSEFVNHGKFTYVSFYMLQNKVE
ncbi:phospholipase D alpha 1-like isoform X1 [Gossypium australe]|uniref:Phospholipase D alpha 1-like isoform X1 n=1 Tax=Gossypium australe TaxID=47621 RepID=A0A5B6X6W8_9ROSI|nr:phospholipase D alpha 1-like isoform X1 [Gossypium australe]